MRPLRFEMAGVSFDLLLAIVIFFVAVWCTGRAFRRISLPSILGELVAGITLGPEFLDVVPYASDGRCQTFVYGGTSGATASSSASSSSAASGRLLASSAACMDGLVWTPRWSST